MVPDFLDAMNESDSGVIINLEVSPGSKAETFPTGYNPWRKAIGISVKAQATDGKANKAVVTLIADFFKRSKTDVSIVSGLTSHQKKILITKVTSAELLVFLEPK